MKGCDITMASTKVDLSALGELSPITAASFSYPIFVPIHPELLCCGLSFSEASLFGLYESCARSFGTVNKNGYLVICITNQWAADTLGTSLSVIKRARSALVQYGLIQSIKSGYNRPAKTIVCLWHTSSNATLGRSTVTSHPTNTPTPPQKKNTPQQDRCPIFRSR